LQKAGSIGNLLRLLRKIVGTLPRHCRQVSILDLVDAKEASFIAEICTRAAIYCALFERIPILLLMSRTRKQEEELPALDDLDRKILNILQMQGNIPNNTLADEVGLTPGPCLRRVQRLKDTGVLLRHTIVQDNAALGYQLGSFAEITLKEHTQLVAQRFVRSMTARKEVLGCHMVTGEFDFMLRICARNLIEYRKLIWDIHSHQDVDKVRSTFMLETFKDDLNIRV